MRRDRREMGLTHSSTDFGPGDGLEELPVVVDVVVCWMADSAMWAMCRLRRLVTAAAAAAAAFVVSAAVVLATTSAFITQQRGGTSLR